MLLPLSGRPAHALKKVVFVRKKRGCSRLPQPRVIDTHRQLKLFGSVVLMVNTKKQKKISSKIRKRSDSLLWRRQFSPRRAWGFCVDSHKAEGEDFEDKRGGDKTESGQEET